MTALDQLTGFELRIRLHACRAAAQDRARTGDEHAAETIRAIDADLSAAVRDAVRRYEQLTVKRASGGLPEPRRLGQSVRTSSGEV